MSHTEVFLPWCPFIPHPFSSCACSPDMKFGLALENTSGASPRKEKKATLNDQINSSSVILEVWLKNLITSDVILRSSRFAGWAEEHTKTTEIQQPDQNTVTVHLHSPHFPHKHTNCSLTVCRRGRAELNVPADKVNLLSRETLETCFT